MATGQGNTWVLVADAHRARIFDVEDAGLVPRLRTTLHARPDGSAAIEGGRPDNATGHGAKTGGPEHGWTTGDYTPGEAEEHRFVHELVRVLERGVADTHFHHLVVVAPPKLLGMLRDGLTRELAQRVRASTHKDWGHLPDGELTEHVRSLVEIWPQR
jgi:protein required for attachment to host cells